MTPAVAGSVLGAAALTFGRGAVAAAGNGLSFAGELLKGASATSAEHDEAPSAKDSARAIIERRIKELQDRIRRELVAAGIVLAKPVELTGDGAGGIAVAADHPQREAIQDFLGNDFLLERDFHQLAGEYDDFVAEQGAGDWPAKLTVVVPTAS
jgi:hypothetical protein